MPIPTPTQGESQSSFIARFMSNDAMKKEFPEEKQRLAVAYSTWRKHKKEIFCNVHGFETKEGEFGDLIKCGYIATTHLDSGFENEEGIYIRDIIAKETLDKWVEEINEGNPRANKVSINHNRETHVAGVGIKGSARVDKLPDGHYGLWVETLIDKTKENFDDTRYRLDKGLLDSFSIEFNPRNPVTDEYWAGAVREEKVGEGIVRTLLPNTELHGWTLASRPMNENCVMLKEVISKMSEINNPKEIKEEVKMIDDIKVVEEKKEVPVETLKPLEVKEEVKVEVKEVKVEVPIENKEEEFKKLYVKLKPEIEKELSKVEVEEKVMKPKEEKMESKEVLEYKEIFSKDSKISVNEQFRIAGRFAESKGMFKSRSWETKSAEGKEYKNFSTNGRFLEFKALGVTTNQNSDTDYLLSAAELSDVFDPVIYNSINQKTIFWNMIAKDDHSSKGNNQVQFTLKTAANSSATAYTGDSVTTSNVSRLKYQTKFKKYQVGVEVSGDMLAAARGGPIGDIFVQEVSDSTDDLMSIINIDLFGTSGLETGAMVIGLKYLADSASYTTLYNLTRSAANRLSPDTAANTYINGSSADLSIANLRSAKRQAIEEGASLNNLVYVGSPIQADKLRSIYDSAQRPIPVSSRFGFEGMMTFDGIAFFEDKDCPDADVFLVDLETHRVAVWVPPTLEMLGKTADSQKGFIKTYFAVYNRAPRRLVWIYANKTT